jgi:hypothetical protein
MVTGKTLRCFTQASNQWSVTIDFPACSASSTTRQLFSTTKTWVQLAQYEVPNTYEFKRQANQ